MMGYATLPNCDCCGRFVSTLTPGTSWKFVPESDVSYEEDAARCKPCTDKWGPPQPVQRVRVEMCSGVVGDG